MLIPNGVLYVANFNHPLFLMSYYRARARAEWCAVH